jgi:hypothetical protein
MQQTQLDRNDVSCIIGTRASYERHAFSWFIRTPLGYAAGTAVDEQQARQAARVAAAELGSEA